jgi:hypothetical protein
MADLPFLIGFGEVRDLLHMPHWSFWVFFEAAPAVDDDATTDLTMVRLKKKTVQ